LDTQRVRTKRASVATHSTLSTGASVSKPEVKRYRFETFCYGPKSCSLYRSGPTRKVPGRSGMSWEEEAWVDEDATSHRDD